MGRIHHLLEKEIEKRVQLEEPEWIDTVIDRQFAINRIHLNVSRFNEYGGKIKRPQADALAMILEFLTSYDLFDAEQIKNIWAELAKLSDI